MKGIFSFPTGEFGKYVIIFGVDMSSSAHVNNKKRDISILGEDPTQELDNKTLTAERKYSINFIEHKKKLCIIMEQIVLYLLMEQKFINLKLKT